MIGAARSRASGGPPRSAGFTLLELAVVLGLMGLLVAIIVPRIGVLSSAALDSSARRLALRIQFLREEAAIRSLWIRLAVDPHGHRYRAERLIPVGTGVRFAPVDAPLYREITVPDPVQISLEGPGVTTSIDGYATTLFSPDGYADPALLWLDDGAGRRVAVVIDPVSTRARILDDDDVPPGLQAGMR